jgi:hypothetical protein
MVLALRLSLVTLAVAALALSPGTDARAASSDPAARGLDAFVRVPEVAAPGASVPVDVEVFGFSTVVSSVPLAGAAIEAVWNPEKMGGSRSQAPLPVDATADANGRAHLDVPMPEGDEGPLELLLGLRSGAHARTRAIPIRRARSSDVQIHVSDPRVVPGSSISAWVLVTSAATGEPLPRVPVDLVLLEGGVPRFDAQLTTDPAGAATARVPIPRSEEPAWSWTLEARAASGQQSQVARLSLAPREETPGTPRLRASFREASVLAADKAEYVIGVRDATDQPVADLPVWTWIGPRGTTPPKEDAEWTKVSMRSTTNAAGEITGKVGTPSTVVQGVGSSMHLVARTSVDGHDLTQEASVAVGYRTASAELLPEASSIVPGVDQRLLLRVRDGHRNPVVAPFLVEGDGLRIKLQTNASGEAELTWKTPVDVGASRSTGSCAGGVAASIRVRPTVDVPALASRRAPFDLCVPVDRDAGGLVQLDKTSARIGDKVHVVVLPAPPSRDPKAAADRTPSRGPWSLVAQSADGTSSRSVWMDDGEKGADIEIGAGKAGIWSISATSPSAKASARVASAALLVAPKTLPKLKALVTGGRAAPGGAVEVDATLTDEHGKPLAGSIAALLIDSHGGGSTAGTEALDTRTRLCAPFDVARDRCDGLVEGDPALDAVRRCDSGARVGPPTPPVLDPGANAAGELTRSFAAVIRSLERVVFESTATPGGLRDVRRRAGTSWQFNPELMTLVTGSMETPPETPGGEPLVLGDLLAVDPQVTFDNVARRVTRLKLFNILAAMRTFRHDHHLDADEPALNDPNAIVRRLVREERLRESMLIDPWGGTIQFTPSGAPVLPFLSVVHGFELRAPGPDGVVGDGDDVSDPFARVLSSGSPYAKAAQEDRVVDAKFEMEVGDETVAAWQSMFQELTGIESDSIGMGGLGTGMGLGGGSGMGGLGRASTAVDSGVAFWAPPARTDDQGHLHLRVPLGDVETTWRLALVGLPDGGAPATTAVDIPVALPLSVRVETGASWIEGDEVSVTITVRNRSARPVAAAVAVAAGGVAEIVETSAKGAARGAVEPLMRTVDVPADGAVATRVRVRATRTGTGRLDVRAHAAGVPDDAVSHAWEVRAAGELADVANAVWVDGEGKDELGPPPLSQSMRIVGAPRLVLERGYDAAVTGALESLDPDRLASADAMADAIEVAGRVYRWAIARGGDKDPVADRAREIARRATGRLALYATLNAAASRLAVARAHVWAPADVVSLLGRSSECPDGTGTLTDNVAVLDAEPPHFGGSSIACWDAFVSNTVDGAMGFGDAVDLARVVLALAERPDRAFLANVLVDRLRERVSLKASGGISLDPTLVSQSSARSIVFASLLRSLRLGKRSVAGADKLAAWVLVQRDARGGYGSSEATRSVVRALLAEGAERNESSRVFFEVGAARRELDVPPSAHIVVPLDPTATKVDLAVKGQGVVARFEQPAVRLWSHPPDEGDSALHVEATWPTVPHAGKTGTLRLLVRCSLSRAMTVDLRIPLPAGVSLAEPVHDVRQVQGALTVRRTVEGGDRPMAVEIPVRFGLGGRVTAPEVVARIAFQEGPRAVAPARSLTILP